MLNTKLALNMPASRNSLTLDNILLSARDVLASARARGTGGELDDLHREMQSEITNLVILLQDKDQELMVAASMGESLITQNQELENQVMELQIQLEVMTRNFHTEETKTATLSEENSKMENYSAEMKSELLRLRRDSEQAGGQLRQARELLTEQKKRIATTQQSLETAEALAEERLSTMETQEQQITQLTNQLDQKIYENQRLRMQVETLQEEVKQGAVLHTTRSSIQDQSRGGDTNRDNNNDDDIADQQVAATRKLRGMWSSSAHVNFDYQGETVPDLDGIAEEPTQQPPTAAAASVDSARKTQSKNNFDQQQTHPDNNNNNDGKQSGFALQAMGVPKPAEDDQITNRPRVGAFVSPDASPRNLDSTTLHRRGSALLDKLKQHVQGMQDDTESVGVVDENLGDAIAQIEADQELATIRVQFHDTLGVLQTLQMYTEGSSVFFCPRPAQGDDGTEQVASSVTSQLLTQMDDALQFSWLVSVASSLDASAALRVRIMAEACNRHIHRLEDINSDLAVQEAQTLKTKCAELADMLQTMVTTSEKQRAWVGTSISLLDTALDVVQVQMTEAANKDLAMSKHVSTALALTLKDLLTTTLSSHVVPPPPQLVSTLIKSRAFTTAHELVRFVTTSSYSSEKSELLQATTIHKDVSVGARETTPVAVEPSHTASHTPTPSTSTGGDQHTHTTPLNIELVVQEHMSHADVPLEALTWRHHLSCAIADPDERHGHVASPRLSSLTSQPPPTSTSTKSLGGVGDLVAGEVVSKAGSVMQQYQAALADATTLVPSLSSSQAAATPAAGQLELVSTSVTSMGKTQQHTSASELVSSVSNSTASAAVNAPVQLVASATTSSVLSTNKPVELLSSVSNSSATAAQPVLLELVSNSVSSSMQSRNKPVELVASVSNSSASAPANAPLELVSSSVSSSVQSRNKPVELVTSVSNSQAAAPVNVPLELVTSSVSSSVQSRNKPVELVTSISNSSASAPANAPLELVSSSVSSSVQSRNKPVELVTSLSNSQASPAVNVPTELVSSLVSSSVQSLNKSVELVTSLSNSQATPASAPAPELVSSSVSSSVQSRNKSIELVTSVTNSQSAIETGALVSSSTTSTAKPLDKSSQLVAALSSSQAATASSSSELVSSSVTSTEPPRDQIRDRAVSDLSATLPQPNRPLKKQTSMPEDLGDEPVKEEGSKPKPMIGKARAGDLFKSLQSFKMSETAPVSKANKAAVGPVVIIPRPEDQATSSGPLARTDSATENSSASTNGSGRKKFGESLSKRISLRNIGKPKKVKPPVEIKPETLVALATALHAGHRRDVAHVMKLRMFFVWWQSSTGSLHTTTTTTTTTTVAAAAGGGAAAGAAVMSVGPQYFFLTCAAVRLNNPDITTPVHPNKLWETVAQQGVPFHHWHDFIRTQMIRTQMYERFGGNFEEAASKDMEVVKWNWMVSNKKQLVIDYQTKAREYAKSKEAPAEDAGGPSAPDSKS